MTCIKALIALAILTIATGCTTPSKDVGTKPAAAPTGVPQAQYVPCVQQGQLSCFGIQIGNYRHNAGDTDMDGLLKVTSPTDNSARSLKVETHPPALKKKYHAGQISGAEERHYDIHVWNIDRNLQLSNVTSHCFDGTTRSTCKVEDITGTDKVTPVKFDPAFAHLGAPAKVYRVWTKGKNPGQTSLQFPKAARQAGMLYMVCSGVESKYPGKDKGIWVPSRYVDHMFETNNWQWAISTFIY